MREYLNLNDLTSDKIEEFDIFNSRNTHNNDEEDVWSYNCMGYAFRSYGWLLPFDGDYDIIDDILEELNMKNAELTDDEKEDLIQDLYNNIYDNSFLIQLAITRMLKFFPELRPIDSFEELKENEYGIVYATCSEDFHFGVYEDGVYSHKMGGLPIQTVENEDEIFYGRYDSKRYYFAMNKEFKIINCRDTVIRI